MPPIWEKTSGQIQEILPQICWGWRISTKKSLKTKKNVRFSMVFLQLRLGRFLKQTIPEFKLITQRSPISTPVHQEAFVHHWLMGILDWLLTILLTFYKDLSVVEVQHILILIQVLYYNFTELSSNQKTKNHPFFSSYEPNFTMLQSNWAMFKTLITFHYTWFI